MKAITSQGQNYTCSPINQAPWNETHINVHLTISHPILHKSLCFFASISSHNILLYTHQIWDPKGFPVNVHKNIKNSEIYTIRPLEAQPGLNSAQFCTQTGQTYLPKTSTTHRQCSEEVHFLTWSGTRDIENCISDMGAMIIYSMQLTCTLQIFCTFTVQVHLFSTFQSF